MDITVPAISRRQTVRLWKPFSIDVSGNVAAIAALTILPILGVIALTLDTRNVFNTKSSMQAAADAASIAAAVELLNDGTDDEVKLAAETAMQNKVNMHTDGLVCRMDKFAINEFRDEVAVGWTCNEPSSISGAIGKESMQFPVYAKAIYYYGLDGCVLALGEYNTTGVSVTGSATVNLESCAVISNSRQEESIELGGSGSLSTTCAYAAGGIVNSSEITTTECLSPVPYGRPTPDPYADLEMPDDWKSWPCITPTSVGKDDIYLSTGRYCNHVSGKEDIELETGGLFIFDGADLRTKSGNVVLHGEEVTLFFTDNAEFDNANGGTVTLSAKDEGDYAGVLMYGDRDDMSTMLDIKINGNISSTFEGAIYFPNNDLTFVGGAALNSECTQLIADTITFSGNSGVQANCESLGTRKFGNVSDVIITE